MNGTDNAALLRWIAIVAAVLALGAILPAAAAHPGVSLGLKVAITDEEVTLDLLLSADFLRQQAEKYGLPIPLPPPDAVDYQLDAPEHQAAARPLLERIAQDAQRVTIDGLEVPPVLREAKLVPAAPVAGYDPAMNKLLPDGHCIIVFPAKGKPRTVSIVWRLYAQDPMRESFGLSSAVELVAALDAYDEEKFVVFTADEPEITWHAPTAPPQERLWPVLAASQPALIPIPLVSAGVIAAWLIVLAATPLVPALRRRGRVVLLATVAPALVAASTYKQCVWNIESPWSRSVKPPSDADAKRILEMLQRNIYRAFDYKRESDVYDVLAQSVDGPLLDDVYNEVHQSLVLRDQGGAVAHVQDVSVQSTDVLNTGVEKSGAVAVQLATTWQVVGAVAHWGHTHTRTNEYNALYTVAQRGERWKITGIQVLSQKRVVKEGDDPLLSPAPPPPPPGPQ